MRSARLLSLAAALPVLALSVSGRYPIFTTGLMEVSQAPEVPEEVMVGSRP